MGKKSKHRKRRKTEREHENAGRALKSNKIWVVAAARSPGKRACAWAWRLPKVRRRLRPQPHISFHSLRREDALWAPSRPNPSINLGALSRLSLQRLLVPRKKPRPVRTRRASLPPGGSIVEEMKYEDVFYTYFYVDSSCACIDPTGPAAAGPFSKWKPDVSTFFKEGIEIGRPLVDW